MERNGDGFAMNVAIFDKDVFGFDKFCLSKTI